MKFLRTVQEPTDSKGKAIYLIFNETGHLLVENHPETAISFPVFERDEAENLLSNVPSFLGLYDSVPCYCGQCTGKKVDFPKDLQWKNLRKLLLIVDPVMWEIAGYAREINDCHTHFKYCGKCGGKTLPKIDEQGRLCPACKLTFYPRISPAVIVAVVRDDEILLARGVNFPNKKMFSVLAGFVDPQERLEDCVKREVFEETGIRVKNVTYFDSQPWPFPDSLMIGFTAEYESGTIKIDPNEIAEASWFSAEKLPLIPGKPTLSAELIQWFTRQNG